MSVRFGTTTEALFRVWFRVQRGGVLVPGIVPGSITVTVINQDDNASITPAVTESLTKPGVYYYDIPVVGWLDTHGAGRYIATVEVNSLIPFARLTLQDPITITIHDLDSLGVKLCDVWQILGLDPDNPLCVTKTTQKAGSIVLIQTEVGNALVLTREP